jgi:hypothetical protein
MIELVGLGMTVSDGDGLGMTVSDGDGLGMTVSDGAEVPPETDGVCEGEADADDGGTVLAGGPIDGSPTLIVTPID